MRSAFGDTIQHGPEGVRFWTKIKTVTSRWPEGDIGDQGFIIPTMGSSMALTEEQILMTDMARAFANERLRPKAAVSCLDQKSPDAAMKRASAKRVVTDASFKVPMMSFRSMADMGIWQTMRLNELFATHACAKFLWVPTRICGVIAARSLVGG